MTLLDGDPKAPRRPGAPGLAVSRRGFLVSATVFALAVACGDTGRGDRATGTSAPTRDGLWYLPLEEAARLIENGEISPVELTQIALDRIEALDPELHAFITVTGEEALARARRAEREIASNGPRSPLHGIPIAYKDMFDTAGVRTTAGSSVWADRVPTRDATIVSRLEDAGAVSLGKLNQLEFATALSGVNPHYGTTRNPWDLEMFSGGSSSGCAAATSAGLVFASLGTDSGGSIRLPAAFCGLVGLMPTYGRVSLHGQSTSVIEFDHAGPLTRTVRDAAIVLDAIAGHDPLDPTTERVEVPDYLEGIERGAAGLRIGLPREYFWAGVEPRIEQAVERALERLEREGAEVRDVDVPDPTRYLAALGRVAPLGRDFWDGIYPERSDELGDDLVAWLDSIQSGADEPAISEAQEALATLTTARAGEADRYLDGVDVLAMPTSRQSVFSISEAEARYRRHDPAELATESRFENTMVFDATGQPAISVPCTPDDGGLPVGLMFVARRFDEATLLRAARAHEQIHGELATPPL